VYKNNNNNKHNPPQTIIKEIKEIMGNQLSSADIGDSTKNNENKPQINSKINCENYFNACIDMSKLEKSKIMESITFKDCAFQNWKELSSNFPNLSSIGLVNCTFIDIPVEQMGDFFLTPLSQLPNLREFFITDNKPLSFSKDFGNMSQLEDFGVYEATLSIESIQNIFRAPKLKVLAASNCTLYDETPLYIPPNLENLILSGNKNLKYLLPAQGGVDFRLESLDVSGTSIDLGEFPFSCIKKLKAFTCLRVPELDRIPLGLTNCPLLEKLILELDNSNPSELERSMFEGFPQLKNLTELKLFSRRNKALSEFNFKALSFLPNLSKLVLSSIQCNTNEFPLALCELTQLTSLAVRLFHQDGISALPESFSNLSKLKKFYFKGAIFSSIPEVLFNIKTLTGLWLCDSPITVIGDKIKDTNIATLDLCKAMIDVSSMKILLSMPSLVRLEVSSDIHDGMKKLPEYQSKSSDLLIWHC